MKQDDRQLLFKDLCARLPYGVKVCARFNTGNKYTANVTAVCSDRDYIEIRQNDLHVHTGSSIEDIRPYLRPMSSMTEEEEEYVLNTWGIEEFCNGIDLLWDNYLSFGDAYKFIDWLNRNYFDYQGLIEKGLALEALEGMYKI